VEFILTIYVLHNICVMQNEIIKRQDECDKNAVDFYAYCIYVDGALYFLIYLCGSKQSLFANYQE